MGQSTVAAGFQISWVAGEAGGPQIGELWHERTAPEATWRTPLGHLAIFHKTAEAEVAAHWQVECFLRDDVRFEEGTPIVGDEDRHTNYPTSLLDDLLEVLLLEARVDEPVLLNAHLGRNVDYRQKGLSLDND